MKKKMCPYLEPCNIDPHKDRRTRMEKGCPKNTNARCEIIPSKREADKVVKGWARIGKVTGEVLASETKVMTDSIPCTLHFKAKNWKRLKGEK